MFCMLVYFSFSSVRHEHIVCAPRLCLVIIVALPVATPKELKNSASYALGNFTNRAYVSLLPELSLFICHRSDIAHSVWLANGFRIRFEPYGTCLDYMFVNAFSVTAAIHER